MRPVPCRRRQHRASPQRVQASQVLRGDPGGLALAGALLAGLGHFGAGLGLGDHLGVTLETVCRLFSRFETAGIIEFSSKFVRIKDLEALKKLTV